MKQLFLGCKGSGFLGTIFTGAAHELKLVEMQPTSSNKCISSSINFWYLRRMGYVFCGIDSSVVGMSILNRLFLPTSVDDLDAMLLNSIFRKGGKFIPSFL